MQNIETAIGKDDFFAALLGLIHGDFKLFDGDSTGKAVISGIDALMTFVFGFELRATHRRGTQLAHDNTSRHIGQCDCILQVRTCRQR